jgi:hypothetical protein
MNNLSRLFRKELPQKLNMEWRRKEMMILLSMMSSIRLKTSKRLFSVRIRIFLRI